MANRFGLLGGPVGRNYAVDDDTDDEEDDQEEEEEQEEDHEQRREPSRGGAAAVAAAAPKESKEATLAEGPAALPDAAALLRGRDEQPAFLTAAPRLPPAPVPAVARVAARACRCSTPVVRAEDLSERVDAEGKREPLPGARCGRCRGVVGGETATAAATGSLGNAFRARDLAAILRDDALALHLAVHPSESSRNDAASAAAARAAGVHAGVVEAQQQEQPRPDLARRRRTADELQRDIALGRKVKEGRFYVDAAPESSQEEALQRPTREDGSLVFGAASSTKPD